MPLNLLPSQAKFRMMKMFWKKRLGIYSTIISSLFLGASVIVIGLLIVSLAKIKANKKSYDQLYGAYKSMATELLTNQQLKYRAKMVTKVLNERPNYGASITKVKSMFDKGFKTDNFQMKEYDTFLIDLSTTDGKQVDALEKIVKDVEAKKVEGISTLTVSSISWSSGIWRVSVEVTTNGKV